MNKYLKWRNYLNFAKRKYLDIKYANSALKIVQTNFEGVEILVRSNEDVGKEILLHRFEIDELRFLTQLLHDNSVILDVGANIGLFSLLLASKAKGIDVHAFEPIELNAHLIAISKQINCLNNITINQSCVGDTDGTVEFSVSSDSAYSSIIDSGRKKESAKIICPICRLDTYVQAANIQKIDFVKIDVEGAEKLVLTGAHAILTEHKLRPKILMIELYDLNLKQYDTSVKDIVQFMSGHDYAAYYLHGSNLLEFDPLLHANKIYNVFFKSITSANSTRIV
ncbi:MAG TPA: FkbM family methyltransferase [Burkholderiaceae bacterium]|nr:FkbM family methyltransferase [Burkholderiaceae bacterium]